MTIETTRHKIGCTRTIKSAILVCEYLRSVCATPHSCIHGDRIRYYFTDPTPRNGFWSADIIVETFSNESGPEVQLVLSEMVKVCRAYVAGRGEIWG